MTRVEMLQAEIENLSSDEFAELRGWLLEKDWEAWDRQIEVDACSGKLGKLFEKAEAEHLACRSRKI